MEYYKYYSTSKDKTKSTFNDQRNRGSEVRKKLIHDTFYIGKHGDGKFSRFIAVHYHDKKALNYKHLNLYPFCL